ncbi:MAG: histidine kinase [Chitinophagaceae bacterium]|nr:histidine kinase [Chitinophagaceae bacterium]
MRFRPTKLQLYSFIASMPIIDFLLNYILYSDRLFHNGKIWLVSYPLIFAIGVLSWSTHVMISDKIRVNYPGLKQSGVRIVLLAFCLIPFMSACVIFIFILYDSLHILGYQMDMDHLKMGLAVGFSINLIFETLYETDYILEKYKESVQEKEAAHQMAMQQEFDTLKSQVNPHFLFNCFNTLSSLISEDKPKAETFLNELSKVYRYLLQNNEDGLSTLQNEVQFVQSYYRLLQTRHGDAVQLNIQIDKRYDLYLLPSMSLQLLIENVVKHNVVSKSAPLEIDIFSIAGNKLVVNNNLIRRVAKAASNRVGLENIKAKYSLLKQPGFQVMEDERNFTVVLPLIWNNTTARTKSSYQTELIN